MKNNGLKNAKAITLIAMVVTIIVLLILAGVSIAVLTGENGILNRATSAKQTHEEKTEEEKLKLGVLALSTEYRSQTTHTYPKFSGFVESRVADLAEELGVPSSRITVNTTDDTLTYIINDKENKYTLDTLGGIIDYVPIPTISKDESFVGYYADLNNDGNITEDDDGIIFVDLARPAKATEGLGQSYSYTQITSGLKDYVSGTAKLNGDGNDVNYLKLVDASVCNTSLADRFYVLGFKDIKDEDNNTTLYGYYSAGTTSPYMSDFEELGSITGFAGKGKPTSTAFGAGKINTRTMIDKWYNNTETGAGIYGEKNNRDMWKAVKARRDAVAASNASNKPEWFITSKEEWAAVKGELVGDSSYSSFGLSGGYWSSSQSGVRSTWFILFQNSRFLGLNMDGNCSVRLAATF